MTVGPEVFKDRYEVTVAWPKVPGKPQRLDIYVDVRGGITWPTSSAPGYFILLGLKKERDLAGKRPAAFLVEGQHTERDRFFEMLVAQARKYHAQQLFANLSDRFSGFRFSLEQFIRNRGAVGLNVFDSSTFPDTEYSVSMIRQAGRDGRLSLPVNTTVVSQLKSMTKDDLKGNPEEEFFAVHALAQALLSWELYPWQKPRKRRARSGRGEGYG